MTSVRVVDGMPALVLDDRDDIEQLERVLHQAHSIRVYRGESPIETVVDFIRAARAAVALIDSSSVLAAEPNSDHEAPIEGAWITTQEASRLLGIGTRAVTKRVASGTLIGRKVGGTLLINSKEMAHHAAA